MNLQPINPPARPGQEFFCQYHQQMEDGARMFADLDAPAFTAYYCRYEAPGCDGNDGSHLCHDGPLRRIPLADNAAMILCAYCFARMRRDDSTLGTWNDYPRYVETEA